MTELEKTPPEPTSLGYVELFGAVKREGDGMFSVKPYGDGGASYFLTEAQLPIFEDWFIREGELSVSFHKKIVKRPILPAFIFAFGAMSVAAAVRFDLIGIFSGALLIVTLRLSLAPMTAFMLSRRSRKSTKVSFPFLHAPVSGWDARASRKRLLKASQALPMHIVLEWVALFYSIFFQLLIVGVSGIFVMMLGGFWALAGVFVAGLLCLLWNVFVIVPFFERRRFRKQFGKPFSPSNIYLSEVGRLSGAD